jgi:hypothetical protein
VNAPLAFASVDCIAQPCAVEVPDDDGGHPLGLRADGVHARLPKW